MIISFRGGIGSGKSTAANHLVQVHNFTRVSFADPLKTEVFDALWTGGEDEVWARFRKETGRTELFPVPYAAFRGLDLYYISDDMKLQWVNENKAALRPLLQWWGTEYRRAQDENYWVGKAETYMRKLLTENRSICMDDCRFDNEIELVAALGGKQIFIICPKAEELAIERSGGGAVGIKGHASEGLLDPNDPRNDAAILNDSTLEEFLKKVNYIKWIIEKHELYVLLGKPI